MAGEFAWADDEELLPQTEIIENKDGTKLVILYKLNDEGKKVKITKRIKHTVITEKVHPAVAERRKWAKYGQETGKSAGPDLSTTQIGEPVQLKLSFNLKEAEKEEENALNDLTKKPTGSVFKCRYCEGEHMTLKCPYKDTLGALSSATSATAAVPDVPGVPGTAKSGYVPPHLRNRKPGEAPPSRFERDDSTTLRVTQLNEIVDESMLREELFRGYRLQRVNVVRNRETGKSRGLAYAAFESIAEAQRALDELNGKGYHSLILRLEWSKPKK